jgi:transcriptional regulator
MYRPNYSVNENQDLALELIREYPLGLLISYLNGKVETSHLPFLLEKESHDLFLISHCAKANPHWKLLKEEVLISFQGPSAYISPTIYFNKMNVPTWSYAVVQVHGVVEIVSDKNSLKDILNKSVHFFEAQNKTSWSYDLSDELQEKLEMAIVGLRIKVTRIEAKFKLSQNRNTEDYNSVLHFFRESKNHKDRELHEWMLKSQP